MKAEERKALETNALAKELGKAIETLKQGPSRSTLIWFTAAVLLVLAVLVGRYFWRSSDAIAAQRWVKLDEVVFPEQLDSFLEDADLKDTTPGRLARFKEARLKLTEGIRDLGANFDLAHKNIETGTKLYEDLISSASKVPLLHQEALWGAAKGNESLGDIDKAREYYTRLVDKYADSSMGKDAKKQLERLDSTAGKRDIAELKKALEPPR